MEVLAGIPQSWREAVRDETASRLSRHATCCGGFYEMMRYQLEAPAGDGGMFCASLCLLDCQAAGGAWHSAVRAAAAIELLFHWFTIHHEIERHTSAPHRDAVWQRWGEAQAINTGDGLFALALVVALQASDDAETALLLSRELCNTSLLFAEEQQLDLDDSDERAAGGYERAALRHMGALSGLSAWAGALMAGCGEDTRQALRASGAELGRAWQLAQEQTASRAAQLEEPDSGRVHLPSLVTANVARQHIDRALTLLRDLELPAGESSRLEVFARGIAT